MWYGMVGTRYSLLRARIYSFVHKPRSHHFEVPIVGRDVRWCFMRVVVSEFVKVVPAGIGERPNGLVLSTRLFSLVATKFMAKLCSAWHLQGFYAFLREKITAKPSKESSEPLVGLVGLFSRNLGRGVNGQSHFSPTYRCMVHNSSKQCTCARAKLWCNGPRILVFFFFAD